MRLLLVFTLLVTALTANPAQMSHPMTSPPSPISSPEIVSLKNDIHALETRLQKSRNRQDWWNNLYLGLGWAAVLLAMAFGVGSLYSQRRAAKIEFSSRPDAELLASKNALLRDVIDKAAQVEVAVAQKDASDASERAGRAEKGAAEATERAAKAQGSLALAEQHSAEANAKAEGFRLDIAKSNEAAVQAQAQVAGAMAEAAKANLELERIKAPRTLRDIEALTESLKRYKGTEYTFSSVFGDEESITLLKQLDELLTSCGWVRIKPPHGFPAINIYGSEQDFAVASGLTSRVSISVNSDIPLADLKAMSDDNLPAPTGAAAALAVALGTNLNPPQEGGVKTSVDPGNSPIVRISVGRKP
jgi:hypothetical protein